jgi:hypothetical protein
MLKRLMTRMKIRPPNGRTPSVGVLLTIPAASVASVVPARSVAHRNGAGHLDPAYEAALRARVIERPRHINDRAFVSGPRSADSNAEECAEDFVMTVTSGEDGGEAGHDEETDEERGGPFVETRASAEFAYDVDESNPAGATREPFPRS